MAKIKGWLLLNHPQTNGIKGIKFININSIYNVHTDILRVYSVHRDVIKGDYQKCLTYLKELFCIFWTSQMLNNDVPQSLGG